MQSTSSAKSLGKAEALPALERLGLRLQRGAGLLCFPLLGSAAVGLMRFAMGYRIPNLKHLRRRARALVGKERKPLIICANHLTLIDSAVIEWALASTWTYTFKFWRLPWSLPEKRNYAHNPFLSALCYLFKCVPVVRGGPATQTQRTLGKLSYLLNRGEALFIFPEGTRSADGRVNTQEFGYGVGRLLTQVAGAQVLCVYQRGQGQEGASSLPRRGSVFYTDMALIQPTSQSTGLRAARDLSAQIVEQLHRMEQKYFATPHRQ